MSFLFGKKNSSKTAATSSSISTNDDSNQFIHQQTEQSKTVPASPFIAASPRWLTFISSPGYNYGTIRSSRRTNIDNRASTSGVDGYGSPLMNDSDTTATTSVSVSESKFTPFVAFCFTLNYVIGTGFLTIPWAFVQSGIVTSTILLVIASLLSDIAKDYLLETMARAEHMLDSQLHWLSTAPITTDTTPTVTSTTTNGSDVVYNHNTNNTIKNRQQTRDDNNYEYECQPPSRSVPQQHPYYTSMSLPIPHPADDNNNDVNERDRLLDNCCTSSAGVPRRLQQKVASSIEDMNKYNINTNNRPRQQLRPNDDENDNNKDDHHETYANNNASSNNKKQQEEYQSFSKMLSIPSSMTKIEQQSIQEQMRTPNRQRFVHNLQKLNNRKSSSQYQHHYQKQNCCESYIIHDRKFEINALCRVYLGKRGLHMFTIFLSFYMCGTLCAYTNVFASAMSRTYDLSNKVIYPLIFYADDNINHDTINHQNDNDNTFVTVIVSKITDIGRDIIDDNYLLYAIIFAFIVVPLSCLELHEQITVQVTMTIGRFIMLFFMLITSPYCASHSTALATIDDDNVNVDPTNTTTSSSFQWTSIFTTLPILVMANVFHHSIPGLSQPVQDKTKLGTTIFRSTIVCTSIMYTILGIVLGITFGMSTEQSANINWHNCYPHSTWEESTLFIRFFKIICYYILLFPVLDVLSAFPLNAITLGNNMFGAIYGRNIHQVEVRIRLLIVDTRCFC
jgi:amino acid permease